MRIIISILSILICASAFSQQHPLVGQYNYNEMIINPASTGDNGALQGLLSWRQQWVGVEGAPSVKNFSVQSPLKKRPNASIGFLAYSDKIGVSSQNGAFINYAYRLKINNSSQLRFGLAGGAIFNRSLYSQLELTDKGDPNFTENTPLFVTPNFSVGVKYFIKDFSIGISVPTILSASYNSGGYTSISNDFGSYNIITALKYKIKLSEKLSLSPSALFKYHVSNKDQVDFMTTLILDDKHDFGLGYRTYEGLLMHFKIGINDQFSFGAQYELPVSSLSTYKASTFEILILYNALFKTNASSPRF